MKYTQYVRKSLIGLFLFIALLQNGCFIFTPVGNAISQGYDNTVSYFNVYYNASRLFGEAEDEIYAAAISMRGKETPVSTSNQANQIPGPAKQKLNQVIDKCSFILAFYPSSSLVDNALILIGKSFYYQAEYLKAERKFEELLASYPNSSLTLEAQLWFAFTEEKLGKYEEGIRLGSATVSDAKASSNDDVETQAHQLLGNIYIKTNQPDSSIFEFEKCIAISNDDEIKSEAQLNLGKIYFSKRHYRKAAESFLKVGEYTSDIYSNYFSKLQASIAYREMGEYNKELSLLDAMIDDFRNKEYLPALLYERANNYAASGRRSDAIDEYIYVDTAYVRTTYATQSAYKLGLIFEKEAVDYKLALKYYSEINSATGFDFIAEGKRKFTALTRYFDAQKRLVQADSLLMVLLDTLSSSMPDTALGKDVIQSTVSLSDSTGKVSTVTDTMQQKNAANARQHVSISADSIQVMKSIAAQELGDIFYSEILAPDSAFYWYNRSLTWNYHPARSPRVLYVLGEHSRTNPEKKFPLPVEYHTRLVRDFPESIYAEEARRFLGKESYVRKTDTAAVYYEQAEKQIDVNQYKKAIQILRKIPIAFPKSPFAAKSEFAIGWIFENNLAQPESAAVQYKRVLKNYSGTTYAVAAAKRTIEEQLSDTIKTKKNNVVDSTANRSIVPALNGKRTLPNPEKEIRRPWKVNPETDSTNAQKIDSIPKPPGQSNIEK